MLQLLGSEHALVVHSNGLDEIGWMRQLMLWLKHGDITEYDISPEDFGIAPKHPKSTLVSSQTQRKPVLHWSNNRSPMTAVLLPTLWSTRRCDLRQRHRWLYGERCRDGPRRDFQRACHERLAELARITSLMSKAESES